MHKLSLTTLIIVGGCFVATPVMADKRGIWGTDGAGYEKQDYPIREQSVDPKKPLNPEIPTITPTRESIDPPVKSDVDPRQYPGNDWVEPQVKGDVNPTR